VPACRTSAASRSLRARAKLAEPSSGLRLVLAFILPIGGWPGAIGDAESQYGTGRPGSQKEAVVLALERAAALAEVATRDVGRRGDWVVLNAYVFRIENDNLHTLLQSRAAWRLHSRFCPRATNGVGMRSPSDSLHSP
jgi:hypothetical protein